MGIYASFRALSSSWVCRDCRYRLVMAFQKTTDKLEKTMKLYMGAAVVAAVAVATPGRSDAVQR